MPGWIVLALSLSSSIVQADPIQAKGTAAGASTAPPSKSALPRDGIAARVNNEIITWKDVDDSLKTARKGDITDDLRLARLRIMAEERLFLQEAKRNNLKVTEQELDDVMRREAKRYRSEEEFEAAIRAMGMTKTEYREEMRKYYLVDKLRHHLFQKAFMNPDPSSPTIVVDTVSPKEMRDFYESHKDEFKAIENITVQRMGLQYNDRDKAEKMRVAEAFVRRLQSGTDFYVAAAYFSTVSPVVSSSESGAPFYGHQALTREEAAQFYRPETVSYLFETMKEDEVSSIRDEGRTLNVFRLIRKVNQPAETFDDAQFRIRRILENQKREEMRRSLRDFLTRSAFVWPSDLFDAPK